MIPTPYYLIDKTKLAVNMARIDRLRAASGAKCLLALKCFATWPAFGAMRDSTHLFGGSGALGVGHPADVDRQTGRLVLHPDPWEPGHSGHDLHADPGEQCRLLGSQGDLLAGLLPV